MAQIGHALGGGMSPFDDARDLALRGEQAVERLAACSLASRSRLLSPSSWTISHRWMRRSTRETTQAAERIRCATASVRAARRTWPRAIVATMAAVTGDTQFL